MNTRPRRDHIRKPYLKDRLQEIVQTMSHFSRVAQKPVWFTYDQLWDIHEKSDSLKGKSRRMTTFFPTRQQFASFVSMQGMIRLKRITVKINPQKGITNDNTRSEARYAYFHPLQDAQEGVDYGGEE